MKIGLNATCFNERPSGAKQRFIGIYSKIFPMMSDSTFVVYEPKDCRIRDWFDDYDNVRYVKTSLHSEHRYKKYIQGLFYWPAVYAKEKFDIFETFNLPLIRGKSEVALLTIHDIRGVYLHTNKLQKALNSFILNASIRKSDLIITVSNYMKHEILRCFPDSNVSVIYNGIDFDNDALTTMTKKGFFEKFHFPDGYMLSVGHFEKRKNYANLIQALKVLHNRSIKETLVMVGNDSGEMASIIGQAERAGLKDYVKILSGITDDELKFLYSQTKLFVFPSIYEGFGIPILEAMQAGSPIALSDIKVFREIAGDKYTYFDPHNPKEIADNIVHCLRYDVKDKQNMANLSAKIAEKFDFGNIAIELKNTYKEMQT